MKLLIPLTLKGGLNAREHPMARHRRVRKERQGVAMAFSGYRVRFELNQLKKANPGGCWLVRLTRFGPTEFDDDNNVGMLKSVRDEVAAALGINDGSKKVEWTCVQAGAENCAVGIHIQAIGPQPELGSL